MAFFSLPPVRTLMAFGLGGIALGALFVFNDVKRRDHERWIYEEAYKAGANAHAVQDAIAARDAAEAARIAEQEREAETARRIAAEQRRTGAAERALADRIARERRNNADLDKCLALDYPDHLRGFVPSSLLLEAPAAGDDSD